ncbi:DUF1217 domain-containing protein [Mangrovicoccus algicola]|uniref:DUF1217 domain-containing protein n=1 Tax=Mangrovicoccus algicola TaxID=2771008 RepID=A0A8J7D0K2_9RHOB|nr:DUF1217 domain-containing protein [Mangrovicoccus algicola]MBE3639568.1 DUF1217 domain-containing protein [Mangrovicoccus algicola]
MYTPLLPGTSLNSWIYLKESRDAQLSAFGRDAVLQREQQAFAQKISGISSVDDLMQDYQTLKVALGAHGLKDDLPNRYFIRQVIEQGTDAPEDFANRLSDARYVALARTFETLGLTGAGDLGDSLPPVEDDLAAAVRAQRGDSPLHLNAAARMSSSLTLGLLGADTADRVWERALDQPGMTATLSRMLGAPAAVGGLSPAGQAAVFQASVNYLHGGTRLGILSDPANAFAAADAYLGTAGTALEDGFSYGGLRDRLAAIAQTVTDDGDRWAALQADGGLRDVVALALGMSSDFAGLSAADQIAGMRAAATALFGRSDFGLFASQANLTRLGDRHLDPAGRGLAGTFSLGAFIAAIETARGQGPSIDQKWESVLQIEPLRASLAAGLGLQEDFGTLEPQARIAAVKQAMTARFGTADPEALKDPARLAALSGAEVDAQVAAISEDYLEQEFRIAVGEQRPELRVAMSVAEELRKAVETGGTEAGQWYRILGNSVLREAFQGAFGLGGDFASMDLDAQVSMMRSGSERLIGGSAAADFLDPANQEALITRYLARAGTSGTAVSSSAALFTTASASSILATIYGA